MPKLNKHFFNVASATTVGCMMFFLLIKTAKQFDLTKSIADRIY